MITAAVTTSEIVAGGVLTLYTLLVIETLSEIHAKLLSLCLHEKLVVYINRKLVHALAAGVVTLLTPLLFHTPIVPTILSFALAGVLLAAKRRGGMRWFQTSEDNNEITFTLAWGASLLATWYVTRDMVVSILPPLYISIGDAVTGFARAALIGRREKHWIGNLAMSLVTVPAGYAVLGVPGAVIGVIAALAERIDRPVDDNVAVAAVASAGIIAMYAAR